jgi:hypothetical protein
LFERTCQFYASRLSYHRQQAVQYLRAQSERDDVLARVRSILTRKLTLSQLVHSVNEILTSPLLLNTVIGLVCKPNRTTQFVRELKYLQRPSVACTIFLEAADRMSCFQTTRMTLLAGYASQTVAPASTFGVPIQNMVTERQRSTFRREAAKPKWVHAEIRMATYLLILLGNDHQDCYLGISKKTCFSCGCILRGLGTFDIRGNHGKVYAQWTLPISLSLTPRHIQSLTRAVHDLITRLRAIVQESTPNRLEAVRESSITTPVSEPRVAGNIFQAFIPDPRDEEREAEWRRQTRPTYLDSKYETHRSSGGLY